jgi:antitoxin component YwqK of YwqJK toxin-antitoxin module
MVLESQLTSRNQTIILNETPYSGFVLSFFENDQPKSIYEVRNGIKDGKVTEYVKDKYFIKGSFKDTILINRLNKEIVLKKKELELLIQDTLKTSKVAKDFLNYEIGSYDKWQKLNVKNNEGKLNKKQKEQFDKYEGLVQLREQSIRKLNNSQNDLQSINQTLKTELNKNQYIPIKSKEYTTANSTKEGAAIIYDSLGNKFGEGNYKNGKQDGEWVYYQGKGKLKGKGKFINGDGTDIGKSGVPKDGRDGLWIFYFENGNKESEGNYKDGILEGQRKIYFSNGKLKENGIYVNDKASGHFVFNHENGYVWTEVDYKEDKKMGLEIVYDEEGKKIKESYLTNDVKNGVEKEYYDDGKLKTEGYFKMGKNHGKVKKFYESGKLEIEVEFQNGKQHGLVNTYFENGKIKYKATFDTISIAENNLIGDFYEYNEDGTLKFHGYAYKDGKLEDKTISNSKSTNQSSVPSELKKVYKCKCCKSTINGLLEGIDKEGEEYNDFFVQLMSGQDADTFYRKLGYDGIYDYLRRDKYKFCTMKCARTCYE